MFLPVRGSEQGKVIGLGFHICRLRPQFFFFAM